MSRPAEPGGIAIVGIGLRLPGARSPVEFWENLRNGVESIRFFSKDELVAAGIDGEVLRDPHYVGASPVIDDFDRFDAAFFSYSPKEAAIMDPQNRLFLEVCWQALEDAGYDPERTQDAVVGVFAGAGSALTSYMLAYSGHPDMQGQTAGLQHINADRDFLSTRVSFKLNLTGPSLTVQTACSTSLVAVHLACQSLQNGECDVALAGASTIRVPHISGYLAEPDSVHSADGHCRSFDASGRGTIFGSGVAAVVLKDLRRAIEDGDHVYAVIKGSAINNDGAAKISYTAASVQGQARAMVEALEVAGVSADTIQYVECHATGTVAGDPIEIQALTRAFRTQTNRRGFCAVGSVKTNIGHPEQSAGLAGLIKAALSLSHRELPPSLHFVTPNPNIPFEASPFYVQTARTAWPATDGPRRAAVNSLGIGGTNAFLILEEAPVVAGSSSIEPSRPLLCCLSAKTDAALRRRVAQFSAVLDSADPPPLEDLCYTANVSRSRLVRRFSAVASTPASLRDALAAFLESPLDESPATAGPGPIAFIFSGQGAQYAAMSGGLYDAIPMFRQAFDACDTLLRPHLKAPLRDIIAGSGDTRALTDTAIVQPALFAVEYAIARTWQAWGINPSAVMGHSVGELVAACIAQVHDLPDAIELVAARGALMQSITERGAMLACFANEDVIHEALRREKGVVGIAAVNSPANTVVSGDVAAIARVQRRLEAAGIRTQPLAVSHAFHSALLDPILPALNAAAARVTSRCPELTLVSNVTGAQLVEAPSPAYWCDHARLPVRFADGIKTLHELGCRTFVEIGPGGSAIAAARECLPRSDAQWLASITKHRDEHTTMLGSLRSLYLNGASVNWDRVHEGGRRARVSIPVYPFEPTRHWLEPLAPWGSHHRTVPSGRADTEPRHADDGLPSFYHVAWVRRSATDSSSPDPAAATGPWFVIADAGGFGDRVVRALKQRGAAVQILRASTPNVTGRLLEALARLGRGGVRRVIDARGLDATRATMLSPAALARAETAIARTALSIILGLANAPPSGETRLWILTRGAVRVTPDDVACEPVPALLWGLGRTAALETPSIWGGLLDLDPARRPSRSEAEDLIDGILQSVGEPQVALRHGATHVARLEPLHPTASASAPIALTPEATYLITGGLGMLALTIATWLVEVRGVKHLALVSRTGDATPVRAQIAALEAAGAQVQILAADVSRSADVRRLLRHIGRTMPPLAGVVHCAGVLSDGILGQMDEAAFTRVTAPKVRGAWLLHHHTRTMPLDFFLLQSSLLSLTGSAGQANYTAANAFLDALVDYRRSLGLPAMAVNWGPWAGAGMAAFAGARGQSIWRDRGVTLIDPGTGCRALDVLFSHPVPHAAVVTCDWSRYAGQLPAPARFFDLVAGLPGVAGEKRPTDLDDLRSRLAAAGPAERRALLVNALQRQLAKELGFARGLDPKQPLEQLGVDSLMAVNLANRLEASLGLRVPLVKLIKSPSLEGLADELLSELAPGSADETEVHAKASVHLDNWTQATRAPAISITRGNGWLVFPKPNAAATSRLFCFNYAGGGAGTYRPWADLISDSIELVAIEPPGRGGRIDEPPFVRLDALLDSLMPELRPYLDKPVAMFGHCLGGLSMFEATRRALASSVDVRHVFVSGCRPPHALDTLGDFEEDLLSKLLPNRAFDPIAPFHDQPESVFARVIQQFDIGITDEFLARPELRRLLLPSIRADFELAYRYRCAPEPPWDVPISCFCGLKDSYVTRMDALGWHRYTDREFRIHYRPGTHYLVAEDRDFIVRTINEALATGRQSSPRSHFDTPVNA